MTDEQPSPRPTGPSVGASTPDQQSSRVGQSATLSGHGRASAAHKTPQRGMRKQTVRADYGPPRTAHDAIGQPPITRWDYASFHVYFEYNRVIHSVVPRHPEAVDHTAQLK